MVKVLRWFFGVTWMLAGLAFMADTTIAGGLLILLAGALLVPPTFPYLAQITGKSFGKPLKVIAVALSLIVGYSLFFATLEKKTADKKKQEQLAYEKLPQAVKDSLNRAKAQQDSLARIQQEKAAIAAVAKDRRKKVEAQFSAYDGSHMGVERAIKQRMNDPDSYEHVSTRFIDKGDYIAVMTQFRGRNAFNGKVLNTAVAKVDFSGNVLSMEVL